MVLYWFCDMAPLCALFLPFCRHIKNCNFDLIFLITNGAFFLLKGIGWVIKNSKDSKNGVKCCGEPSHHIYLNFPLKNLWLRYFQNPSWEFHKTYTKLIFSVSLIMWIVQNSLKPKWRLKCTVQCQVWRIGSWFH